MDSSRRDSLINLPNSPNRLKNTKINFDNIKDNRRRTNSILILEKEYTEEEEEIATEIFQNRQIPYDVNVYIKAQNNKLNEDFKLKFNENNEKYIEKINKLAELRKKNYSKIFDYDYDSNYVKQLYLNNELYYYNLSNIIPNIVDVHVEVQNSLCIDKVKVMNLNELIEEYNKKCEEKSELEKDIIKNWGEVEFIKITNLLDNLFKLRNHNDQMTIDYNIEYEAEEIKLQTELSCYSQCLLNKEVSIDADEKIPKLITIEIDINKKMNRIDEEIKYEESNSWPDEYIKSLEEEKNHLKILLSDTWGEDKSRILNILLEDSTKQKKNILQLRKGKHDIIELCKIEDEINEFKECLKLINICDYKDQISKEIDEEKEREKEIENNIV